MPAGLLMSNPYLRKVNLRNNELEKIVALTILLMHPDAEIIDLKYSSTQFLELDAIIIDGPKSLFIDMAHTKIKKLEEYVWQPILEQNATINFEACDLECGCTSQWLPAREEFHPLVIEAWCYDGWLPALTKDDFIMRNKVNCTIVL
ncbi:unnamed protein product [Meganyctiphanes norvegica]|uniref:Uncharacterized protein n=1 Tax=Meganyctiphanes norvegica TaxID=48144 RepID=A0AAV2QI31_MEGNR